MKRIGLTFTGFLLVSVLTSPALAFTADSVLSHDVKEADGTSGQDTNNGSGIKTGHIQNGAVTDAKIAGPISASKISSAGLDADTVDGMHAADLAPAVHTHAQSQVTGLEPALAGKSDVAHDHDALYRQKAGKTARVAQTGGDYTSPVAAMNNLASWCGVPSATNPCLVEIKPGVYNIGADSLQMQQYVGIEGAGEITTKLTGTVSGSGVVRGASNAEIRFLTIEATGAESPVAVYNSGVSPKMTNVTAVAMGQTGTTSAVVNDNASPVMTNVTVSAEASSGNVYTVYNIGAASAPVITNIMVSMAGCGSSSWCMGIISESGASPVITNGIVTVRNLSNAGAVGIYTSSGSTTKISNVRVNASTIAKGVWAAGTGSATVTNSTITVDNNVPGSCPLECDQGPTATLKIEHSIVSGGYGSICGGYSGGGLVYVANTKIEGATTLYDIGWGGTGGPTTKCINAYDGNFDALNCP